MKETVLDRIDVAGYEFAVVGRRGDEDLDEDTLHDAIVTGHIAPDEIGEAFIVSVLESLGLDSKLEQRRLDRIEKIRGALVASFEMGLLERRASREDLEKVAEKIICALFTEKHEE